MALIPSFFLDCVVAIGVNTDRGPDWIATGFLYGHFLRRTESEYFHRVYLVTTRHVVEEVADMGESAILRFNPMRGNSSGKEHTLIVVDDSGNPQWLEHDESDADVAVIPINTRKLRDEGVRFAFFHSDKHVAAMQKAEELGITEGDHIYVLGYPMDRIGGNRNFVIARHGTIARIRDAMTGLSEEFLVDSMVFPGTSGGPVVIRPEVGCVEGTPAVDRSYLIGIVKSYVPYRDVAISSQTNEPRVIFAENSGLAPVVPIDFAVDLVRKHLEQSEFHLLNEETEIIHDPPE